MKISRFISIVTLLALGLSRAAGQPAPGAGGGNPPVQTNEWADPDEIAASNYLAQIEELARANGLLPTNTPAATNDLARSNAAVVMARAAQVSSNPPPPQPVVAEAVSRPDRERETRPAAASNRAPSTPPASSTGSGRSSRTSRTEFTAFRIISDRNIFDPNRRPNRPDAPRARPKTVDSFSLVGVMSYDKGSFAFFDGSSSSFRKALKNSDSIAGFKVTEIRSDRVKLAANTNTFELQVGMQMRREEEGEWKPSRQAEAYVAVSSSSAGSSTASPGSASSAPATPPGADSDVLKRLMQRREQE